MSFLLFIAFAILQGAVLARLFVLLVERGRPVAAWALVGVAVVWAGYFTMYLVYGAGFFGRALICLTIPAGALAVLVGLRYIRRFFDEAGQLFARRSAYFAGVLAIALLQFSPFVGFFGVRYVCGAINRGIGHQIRDGIGLYHNDHGAYPDDIDDLIPKYLARAPQPRCFGPHRWFGNELDARSAFELQTCDRPGVTLLTVPQVTTEFIQRMDLDSNRWSTISFLDGVCSYLE